MEKNQETIPLKKIGVSEWPLKISGIITFTFLTIIGAHIAIPLPFTPVPLTLQTLFVILSGAFLGAVEGGASQLSYLILGIAGLPVFAGGAFGLSRLFGPTGGYLIGFVVASYFLGWFLKRENTSWGKTLTGILGALLILYSLGVLQLALVMKVSLQKAFLLGVLPFMPGEAAKMVLAVLIYKGYKNLK